MFSFYLFHKFNILIFAAHYGIEPLFRRYVSHLPKAPQDLFFNALIWANYFDSFHGVETDKPTGTGDGTRTRIYRLERPIT